MPEEFDDTLVQYLAAAAPSFRAGQPFHTRTEAAKPQQLRLIAQLQAQFVPQPREKEELTAFAGFGELQEIEPACVCGRANGALRWQFKAVQDPLQGFGEFPKRYAASA